MRRFLVLAFGFAFAFVLLGAWMGPKYLAWYFKPPVDLGPNMLNCNDPMLRALEWGMNRLLLIQLAAAALGLLAGLAVTLVTRQRVVATASLPATPAPLPPADVRKP